MPGGISIVVGGDICADRHFYADGQPISSAFEQVAAITREADVAFASYEMPLSTRGRPMEKLTHMRADPAIASDIGELGFSVLSLANNHIMDYGPEALTDTIANLRAEGVAHVGAGDTLSYAADPVIVNIRDWKIGFLAFTCLVAPGAGATATGPGVAPLRVHSSYQVNPYWQVEEPGEPAMVTIRTFADPVDQAFAEECVATVRGNVDFLCLSIHWGYGGHSSRIADYQRPLGHALIDAGADIVLGSHVHAAQGVERYKGRIIVYSPGTFLNRRSPPEPGGGEIDAVLQALVADMSPDGFLTRIDVDPLGAYSVRLIPTSLDSQGLPFVATGEILDRIAARVTTLSAELGTHLALLDGGLRLVP